MDDPQIEPRLAAAVLAAIADGVVVLDAEGRIAGLNPSAAKLCGIPAARALGRPWMEVMQLRGGTDNAALGQLFEELRYDADAVGTRVLVREDDTELLGPNGPLPVDVHILHGRIGDGEPEHLILLLREAGHRRRDVPVGR